MGDEVGKACKEMLEMGDCDLKYHSKSLVLISDTYGRKLYLDFLHIKIVVYDGDFFGSVVGGLYLCVIMSIYGLYDYITEYIMFIIIYDVHKI